MQMSLRQIVQQGKKVSAICPYAQHCLEKYSDKVLTVIQIFDEDYGCEGIPDGQELMCNVFLQDTDGNQILIKIPDSYITENGINEGDIVEQWFSFL